MNHVMRTRTCARIGAVHEAAPPFACDVGRGLGSEPEMEVFPLNHQDSRPVGRYPIPWSSDPKPYPPSGAALRFGMPASYEDMVALALNPYTGERTT